MWSSDLGISIDSQGEMKMTDTELHLRTSEKVDEFLGLKIIQRKQGPSFSLDAIILAQFVTLRTGDAVMDLGSGSGIISLILGSKPDVQSVVGVEIQEELADMSRRSVRLNRLDDKIQIVTQDIRQFKHFWKPEQFDLLACNPPYRRVGDGRINPDPVKAIFRHEIKCKLEDILSASSYLLRNNGRAAFVYRPERIADLIAGCRKHLLEPKRLQFVHPGVEKEANLVLLEAVKNGRPGVKIFQPLVVSGHQVPTPIQQSEEGET